MRQDDVSPSNFSSYSRYDDCSVLIAPVFGVQGPVAAFDLPIELEHCPLVLSHSAVRGPEQSWPTTAGVEDSVLGAIDLPQQLAIAQFEHVGVGVRVVSNLVTLLNDTLDQIRVPNGFLANHKECCSRLEQSQVIEQPGRKVRVRTVIERQGIALRIRLDSMNL
nr:hypothetical protein [Rhodobacter sp. NTK016B]